MFDWVIAGYIFAALDLVLACWVTVHAVLYKRDTRAVIGWVGLAWLAPIVGSLAYWVLGINRIHRKARALREKNPGSETELVYQAADLAEAREFSDRFPNLAGLAWAGHNLSDLPLLPGNTVRSLVDGDQAFPAMLEAIDNAQTSVALLSYIFDSDRSGEQFLQALDRARQRGVEVRVLIDSVGAAYSKPNMLKRLGAAGIRVAAFLPTRIPRLATYANLRNHRKILVVDGQIGFTGGTNIREGHCLELKPGFPVECLHFRLEGPVVAHLQRVFVEDWAFTTGEQLDGHVWFPEPKRVGSVWARGIEHGPDENFEKLADLLAAALASARHRVRIVTPYFLPNAALIQALNVAAMRRVDVEVLLPAKNNIALVQWASMAQLWQVLDKGCRVFLSPEPFDHTKLMVVDDFWALIGSTNWDPRSLRLNFEFNVEVFNARFASELNQIMDKKFEAAREITLEQVNGRSLPVKLRDGLARLFKPYL